MERIRVLFVCIHNSARSQMAEAFLNTLGDDRFVAESAGIEPGTLNPLVVEVMNEVGIDISRNPTKSVKDFVQSGKQADYVVTVCDETSAERCPIVPGTKHRLHWSFRDPSQFSGSKEEILNQIRVVREEIRSRIEEFITVSSHSGMADDADSSAH